MKNEHVEQYLQGWSDGTYGKRSIVKWSDEYEKGFADGVQAFRDIADKTRKRLSCPLTTEIND